MAIAFGNQFTVIPKDWTGFKSQQSLKGLRVQYDDDGTVYTVYSYDGVNVYVCTIWKGAVPGPVSLTYSQTQNDADRVDFESNHQAGANAVVDTVNEVLNNTFEADVTNLAYPANGKDPVPYLAVSLSNPNSSYRHPPKIQSLRLSGITGTAAKTNITDLWTIQVGVVLALDATTATVVMISPGAANLTDSATLSGSSKFETFPLPIECEVASGATKLLAGGFIKTVSGIGTSVQLRDASGALVFAGVGDVVLLVSCVSDATGLFTSVPLGSLVFNYHFWYNAR